MKNLLKQITAAALALLLFTVSASPAHAAFPGQNGKLTYSYTDIDFENSIFDGGIADIDLNGANERYLYTGTWHGNFDSGTRAPRYSADGSRITYTQENGSYDLDIYTMNADGTNQQNVTNLNHENGRTAQYSSFHPDGNMLAYGEMWFEESDMYGDIFTINTDGTNKQQLTAADPDYCNAYPVFSPDGNKIAFYRGDRNAGTGGIYTMNADGTNQQEVIQVVSTGGCWFNSIAVGPFGDAGLVSNLDWSPDGTRLVYIAYDIEEGELTSSLRTVDLAGNEESIYEQVSESFGSILSGAQYTPDGKIVFIEHMDIEDDSAMDGLLMTVSIQMINTDGSGLQTIISKTAEGELGAYSSMFIYLLPTIQPVHNIATLSSEANTPLKLTTPTGTKITCSTALTEASQSAQDATYTYPLGLVDFCFDTTAADNTVTLTFVTDLKPNQVVARKYNSTYNTYFNIEGATITETTYNNQPALQLTYTIADNGPLDLDPTNGKIKDPVGLAVADAGASGSGELASTGVNKGLLLLTTFAVMGGAGWLIVRQMKNSHQI